MRIKSYFDSSIPAAMRQARTEFGEDVMLVTSRIASPEFRYLGDYEVVFAVDGSETPLETPRSAEDQAQLKPVASSFGEFMRQQFVPAELSTEQVSTEELSTEEARTEDPSLIVSRLQSTFIDLGIAPAQAELLAALIRSCIPPLPEPATGLPELVEPISAPAESPLAFEMGAVELNLDIAEPAIEPSVPTEDERKDRRPRQKSSVSGKAGLAMMLVALGFGMFRPVRTPK